MKTIYQHARHQVDERTGGLLRRLSVPLIATALSPILISLADVAIVGRSSETALASIGVGIVVFSVFQMVLQSIGLAYQIVVARWVAAQSYQRVRRLIRLAVLTGLAIAIGTQALVVLAGEQVVGLFIDDSETAAHAHDWLVVRCLGLFAYIFVTVFAAHLQVCLKATWTLAATVLANVVNALLSYALVYGGGPFPVLGVVGSAWGSVAAELITALALLTMVRISWSPGFAGRPPSRAANSRAIHPAEAREGREFANVFTFELGSILTLFLSEALFVWMIASLGEHNLSAAQISLEVVGMSFSLTLAFGAAVQIIEGRSYVEEGRRQLWALPFQIGIPASIVWGLIVFLARDPIISVFTSSADVAGLAADTFVYIAAAAPIILVSSLFTATLRAARHSRDVLIANSVATWIFQIGGAAVLVFLLDAGLVGAVIAYALYYVSKATVLGICLGVRGYFSTSRAKETA